MQDAEIAEFQQPPVQSDIGDKSAEAITDAIPAVVRTKGVDKHFW